MIIETGKDSIYVMKDSSGMERGFNILFDFDGALRVIPIWREGEEVKITQDDNSGQIRIERVKIKKVKK